MVTVKSRAIEIVHPFEKFFMFRLNFCHLKMTQMNYDQLVPLNISQLDMEFMSFVDIVFIFDPDARGGRRPPGRRDPAAGQEQHRLAGARHHRRLRPTRGVRAHVGAATPLLLLRRHLTCTFAVPSPGSR